MIRLFKVFIPAATLALLATEALLILGCLLLATYAAVGFEPVEFELSVFYEDGPLRLAFAVSTVLLGYYFQDLYRDLRVQHRGLLISKICIAASFLLFGQALLAYLKLDLLLARRAALGGVVLLLLLLPAWRIFFASTLLRALPSQSILFLGSGPINLQLAAYLVDHPELSLSPIGFVDNHPHPDGQIANLPLHGSLADLRAIAAAVRPALIVVGLQERRQALPIYDLLDLRFQGIRIEEAARLYETIFQRVPIRELRPSQLIFTTELGPNSMSLRLQSLYCFLIAAVALLLTLPLLLLVALAVKLSSPGPVLFRQQRVGMNGKVFTLYKFRSMVANAEAQTGPVWATRDDPRVTPVGRFLRRTRLDELPQLFNVIRGEMSIVGPRPERPEFVRTLSEMIPFYRQRHCVRPGITGWAQINYKYGDTVEDTMVKLEYDLYYIKNLSFVLDLFIILNTAKVMLLSEKGQ
jgi:exopolysaccharide biosynthesis polyprenyl glycosylphosphotransferase